MRCPVCQGEEFKHRVFLYDDRYGHPNNYSLIRCRNCGHLATYPQVDEAELAPLYEKYYPRKHLNAIQIYEDGIRASKRWSPIVRWWCGTNNQGQYLSQPGQTVLDFGFGSGCSLLEINALGAKAFGIEQDPNVRPIAEALKLNVYFGSLEENPFPGEFFDLILMNQTAEHLPQPDRTLLLLRKRLSPHGKLIIVVPNRGSIWNRICRYKWIHWHIPYHQHHFTRNGFHRMAERCGFKVRATKTITPNLWTVLQIRALFARAVRGVRSPIWSSNLRIDVTARQGDFAKVRRSLVRAAPLILIALFNRMIDCAGLGDSLMLELERDDAA